MKTTNNTIRIIGTVIFVGLLAYAVRGYVQSDNWDNGDLLFTTQSDGEYTCDSVTSIPKDECTALVTLYEQTNGSEWFRNDRWLMHKNPCAWRGVVCEDDHVVSLNLSRNNLQGTIPANMGWLTELYALFLGDNNITGSIPESVAILPKLRHVELSKNNITGSVPYETTKLGNQAEDIVIFLNDNSLCDVLPENLHKNTKIKLIDVNKNSLTIDETAYSKEMWTWLQGVMKDGSLDTQSPELCNK